VPAAFAGEPTAYPVPVAIDTVTVSEGSTDVSFTGVNVIVTLAEPALNVSTEPEIVPPVTVRV
jgi:hypothetical protein